jgi:hypothetical protein
MRFNLDEPLIPIDWARHGLVPTDTITTLESDWKVAKVDEWCAVNALHSAATGLRNATGLPAAAPIAYVLTVAASKAPDDARVRRALVAYETAASRYEGVRVHLTDLRNQATIPAT